MSEYQKVYRHHVTAIVPMLQDTFLVDRAICEEMARNVLAKAIASRHAEPDGEIEYSVVDGELHAGQWVWVPETEGVRL